MLIAKHLSPHFSRFVKVPVHWGTMWAVSAFFSFSLKKIFFGTITNTEYAMSCRGTAELFNLCRQKAGIIVLCRVPTWHRTRVSPRYCL